jgi:hypothetical protein
MTWQVMVRMGRLPLLRLYSDKQPLFIGLAGLYRLSGSWLWRAMTWQVMERMGRLPMLRFYADEQPSAHGTDGVVIYCEPASFQGLLILGLSVESKFMALRLMGHTLRRPNEIVEVQYRHTALLL